MNTPDKIYVSRNFSKDNSPHGLWYLNKSEHDINVEYLRKDALLEWVKECYEVTENDNLLSNIFKQGALYELHRVIAKIESL